MRRGVARADLAVLERRYKDAVRASRQQARGWSCASKMEGSARQKDRLAGWIVPAIVVSFWSRAAPSHGRHSPSSASLTEVFKLSHRWERKVEMEGLAPSGP
jgi:hypothetical protein